MIANDYSQVIDTDLTNRVSIKILIIKPHIIVGCLRSSIYFKTIIPDVPEIYY
jgi:hypothetical protein